MDLPAFVELIGKHAAIHSDFEEVYNGLVENNPLQVMYAHIENMLNNANDESAFTSAVLLGRLVNLKGDVLLNGNNVEYVKSSLLELMANPRRPVKFRMYFAGVVADFAKFYCPNGLWNNLGEQILSICACDDIQTISCGLECLAFCIRSAPIQVDKTALLAKCLSCEISPEVYVYGLRVVYASDLVPEYLARIAEILTLDLSCEILETILSDLTNYIEDHAGVITLEQASSLLHVLFSLVTRSISDGAKVCVILLISLLVSEFPSSLGEDVEASVKLLFQIMCTESEDVSREAALASHVMSLTIGSGTQFATASWMIGETFLVDPNPRIRMLAYVFIRKVLPGVAIIWFCIMPSDLWKFIKNGFLEAETRVRVSAYSLGSLFLQMIAEVYSTFDCSEAIPDVLECFNREKDLEALVFLMKLFLALCVAIQQTNPNAFGEIAGPVTEIFSRILGLGTTNAKLFCLAIRIARVFMLTRSYPIPEISELCKTVCKSPESYPLEYCLECLETLALSPREPPETAFFVLELVFRLSFDDCLSSADVSRLNDIVSYYILNQRDCIAKVFQNVVEFVIRGVSKPFQSIEFPASTNAKTIVDYIHAKERSGNTIICYDPSEVDNKVSYLRTLSRLFSAMPEEMQPFLQPSFNSIISLSKLDSEFGLAGILIECYTAIFPHLHPAEQMELIKICATFSFSEICEWKMAIDRFTNMFSIAIENYPSSELRDIAVSLVCEAIPRMAVMLENSERIESEIEDVRWAYPSYHEFGVSIGNLMKFVFRKFGDCGGWREVVEQYPTLSASINIVSQFYEEVEQDEKTLTMLMQYLSIRADDGGYSKTTFDAMDAVAPIAYRGLFPNECLPILLGACQGTDHSSHALCVSVIIGYADRANVTQFVEVFLRWLHSKELGTGDPLSLLKCCVIIEQGFLPLVAATSTEVLILKLISALIPMIEECQERADLIARIRGISLSSDWRNVHKDVPKEFMNFL